MAEEKQIGKITHYFGKIGVGVVELTDELKVGDTIHIVGGERDFTQTVSSMQIEHQNVEKAGAGEAIGLKVDQPVKEGDKVYKVTE
jgi:putative protease